MMSRTQLQSHNSFNGHSYLSNSINPRSHLPPDLERKPFDTGNLQAGRKRAESEVDSTNDSRERSPVRRRISRACDQCNQLRTKCDGKNPCAHCVDIGVQCEYARVHKKRGRAPKRDQDLPKGQAFPHDSPPEGDMEPQPPPSLARKYSHNSYIGGQAIVETIPSNTAPMTDQYDVSHHNSIYSNFNGNNDMAIAAATTQHVTDGIVPGLPQQHFQLQHPSSFPSTGLDALGTQNNMQQGFGFPLGDDYSVAFMGKAPMVESPDWMALTTPMFSTEPPLVSMQMRAPDTLRFPVLQPLLPHIESIMPLTLACELLEQYFASSTSAYLRPSNPYVLGYIFRKASVLHPTDPRPCTPALLSSMLWIAAQTSDAPFLSSQLDARGKVCQKLLELTITMLKPLIHNFPGTVVGSVGYTSVTQSDAGLGGLVVPTDQTGTNSTERIQVDNLATYIHLATVVSASERKAASLRWWNAAWSLAREMKLGRELPEDGLNKDGQQNTGRDEHSKIGDAVRRASHSDQASGTNSHQKTICQEEREERRRAWWLLYMQDRHLALCYNRPMFFLNKECESLLQPLDDEVWQSHRFEQAASTTRRRGLNIECTSHSVFGYFLPLMVILGEILDLNHARNRPRFGPMANRIRNWDEPTEEITQQLEMFEHSLREFEISSSHMAEQNQSDAITPSVASGNTGETQFLASESGLQTKTVIAYATHITHVLHVLLTGKWDPIALLDDNDLWISSQSFVTATGHAVSAAEAVADVIDYDPDLSFMPFFFGVYLLQGSFLLLLFADKLQGDVSPDVVKACETIVRAHEACVATLDTQYQRNFRKVMRSALQQVRGRTREDPAEQQNWRREVLKLYRWTGDGTGLAL